MIEHRGDFYGVGQGLFVTGTVEVGNDSPRGRHLNYIYDCGTDGSRRLLEECVDEAVNDLPDEALDLLFISHFHWDHVAGLSRLLERLQLQGGVKKAVLPYLYPSERAVVMANAFDDPNYPGDPRDWYSSFLVAPGTFLREHGVQEVYFVRGGDGPETLPLREIMPHGPTDNVREYREEEESTSLPVTVHADTDSEQIEKHKRIERDTGGDLPDSLSNLMTSRSTLWALYWFFLLFNKEVDETKMAEFFAEFEDIRNGRPLTDLLDDERIRKRIQVAYEQLVGRGRLNDSSLAVLSACDMTYVQAPSDFSFSCVTAPCMPSRCRLPEMPLLIPSDMNRPSPFRWRRPDMACTGFVYTGDLPAKDLWSPLSRKFGLEKSRPETLVLAYQIPHHGSKNNWHTPQAQLEGNPTYVLSAGTRNRHGHPDPEVLRDIAGENRRLIWANENCSFPSHLRIA